MKIITVAIQKGGTGKTTTAAALSQAAVYRGYSCLSIDLDPQANLSLALGARTGGHGSYDLLTGYRPEAVTQETKQGVDVIPAQWDLSTITSGPGSANRLRDALVPVMRKYRIIIIDVPSQVGELQYNAIRAATDLIIPLEEDIYNLQSLYQTSDTARAINPDLQRIGAIFTKHDTRAAFTRQMRETISQKAQELNFQVLGNIRRSSAIREAAGMQTSLYEYAKRCNPARDYLALFDIIAGAKKGKPYILDDLSN